MYIQNNCVQVNRDRFDVKHAVYNCDILILSKGQPVFTVKLINV